MSAYDPTPAELDAARERIAAAAPADVLVTAFTQIAGRLDGIGQPHTDIDQSIREMRAVLAAYDERKAAKS